MGGGFGFLLPLLFSLVFAQTNYCSAPVSVDISTCTSYGTGHINTFDGLAYDFHEYGEFILFRSAQNLILSRQTDCDTSYTIGVPIEETTSYSATCNRAFLFQDLTAGTSTYEIRHDINNDNLTFVVDGTVLSGGSIPSALTGFSVYPIQYVNPYKTMQRDSKQFMRDADFLVNFFLPPNNIKVVIIFYATGRATIQLTLTTPVTSGIDGLCGWRDGCPGNDLVLRSDATFNPPTSSNARIVNVDGTVGAGTLPIGAQFIDPSTVGNPGAWASRFGTSWRVANQAGNQFQHPTGNNYNIRKLTTKYSGPSGSCSWASGNSPKFIVDQCKLDVQSGNDPDGFDALYSYHVFLLECAYYCTNGIFAHRNPQLQPSQCNAICEYPQGDTTQDLHLNYSSDPLPPNLFQNSDESGALFTSTLNLGGEYTFQLNTTDNCESRVFNLTRTIRCKRSLDLDKPSMTPSTKVKRNYWFGYPIVWILSSPPKSVVRASWRLIDSPASAVWADMYQRSFTPMFIPMSNTAGTYVYELAVYDGCQIKKQNITFVLECSSCPSASIVDVAHLKEVLWNLDLDTAQQGYVLTPTQSTTTYPTKMLSSGSPGQDWPEFASLDYEWSLLSDDDSSDLLVRTSPPRAGTQTFEKQVFQNSTIAEFAALYPDGAVVNYSESDWNSTVTTYVSGPISPLASTKLLGPINTTYGVFPPQREFNIVRDGFIMANSTVTTSTMTNTTVIQTAIYTVPCTFTINNALDDTASLIVTPSVATFDRGAQCEGQYNLQLNVSEFNCKFSTDIQKVDVNCGLAPEVFVACPIAVAFNYNTQTFGPVTIDASKSEDVYGRPNLQYRYSFVSDPSNGTSTLPVGSTTANTATFTPAPNAPGTYQVAVEVSNYCSSNQQTATVVAYCPNMGPADTFTSTIDAPVTSLTYDAGNGYSRQIQLAANSDTNFGVTPTNSWRILSHTTTSPIPPPTVANIPPASITPTTGSPATVNFNIDGTYRIEMIASIGCNRTINNTVDLQFTCGASYTISLDPSSQEVYWDVNRLGGPGFPQVDFTYTIAGQQDLTPTGYWYLNDTFQTSALSYSLTHNTPSPATDMVGVWVSDGCHAVYAWSNITWKCYPMTAVLTASATTMYSGETITLDGTQSNVSNDQTSTALTWEWLLVSGPTDNPNSDKFNLITLNQTQVNFTATWAGTYTFVLRVWDGCSYSTNSSQVTITVNCARPLVITPATSTPMPAFWNKNAFPVINLDSNVSPSNYSTAPEYQFQWRMVSAPNGSVYQPTYESFITTTFLGNSSLPPNETDGYLYTWLVGNTVRTEVETNTYVYLYPNNNNINTVFPSCFTPDLEGEYTVELWAQDQCQQTRSTITLQANCPLRPLPDLNVTEVHGYNTTANGNYVTKSTNVSQPNTWTVTLSRSTPRRVVLDARGTKGYSNSKLSYYWAWNYPDPRAGTGMAQDSIETPYASTSALLLSKVGTYHLSLYVHDGCGYQFLNFTINAVCGGGSLLTTSLAESASTDTTGQPLYTWALMFSDKQNECAKSNNWTFVNFTATPGNAGSSVRSSMTTLVVALIASLFFTRF